jgi:hypothetical protein
MEEILSYYLLQSEEIARLDKYSHLRETEMVGVAREKESTNNGAATYAVSGEGGGV